jgi:hypothetical protein
MADVLSAGVWMMTGLSDQSNDACVMQAALAQVHTPLHVSTLSSVLPPRHFTTMPPPPPPSSPTNHHACLSPPPSSPLPISIAIIACFILTAIVDSFLTLPSFYGSPALQRIFMQVHTRSMHWGFAVVVVVMVVVVVVVVVVVG